MTERDLQDQLRALRPRPDHEQIQRMDARMQGALENAPARPAARPAARSWRVPQLLTWNARVAVAGGLAVLAVGYALVGHSGTQTPDGSSSPSTLAQSSSKAQSAVQGTVPPRSELADTAQGMRVSPPADDLSQPRRVHRDAQLQLEVTDVFRANRQVNRIVGAAGGVVLSAALQQGQRGAASARLQLSVPTEQAGKVVAQLADLGRVVQRTQSAQDITAAYNQAQLQREEVLAERRSLLHQLALARGQAQRQQLKFQLQENRQRLRVATETLAEQQQRAGQATITVELQAASAARQQARNNGSLDLREAATLAGHWLSAAAAYGLLLGLLASPLLLGWALLRWWRRR